MASNEMSSGPSANNNHIVSSILLGPTADETADASQRDETDSAGTPSETVTASDVNQEVSDEKKNVNEKDALSLEQEQLEEARKVAEKIAEENERIAAEKAEESKKKKKKKSDEKTKIVSLAQLFRYSSKGASA